MCLIRPSVVERREEALQLLEQAMYAGDMIKDRTETVQTNIDSLKAYTGHSQFYGKLMW